MSYTPTNWTNGDVITTAKLNKIENGIAEASNSGSNVLIINNTKTQDANNVIIYTLDKTWQQIHDAMLSSGAVIQIENRIYIVREVFISSSTGSYVISADENYTTDSASGYPVYESVPVT